MSAQQGHGTGVEALGVFGFLHSGARVRVEVSERDAAILPPEAIQEAPVCLDALAHAVRGLLPGVSRLAGEIRFQETPDLPFGFDVRVPHPSGEDRDRWFRVRSSAPLVPFRYEAVRDAVVPLFKRLTGIRGAILYR